MPLLTLLLVACVALTLACEHHQEQHRRLRRAANGFDPPEGAAADGPVANGFERPNVGDFERPEFGSNRNSDEEEEDEEYEEYEEEDSSEEPESQQRNGGGGSGNRFDRPNFGNNDNEDSAEEEDVYEEEEQEEEEDEDSSEEEEASQQRNGGGFDRDNRDSDRPGNGGGGNNGGGNNGGGFRVNGREFRDQDDFIEQGLRCQSRDPTPSEREANNRAVEHWRKKHAKDRRRLEKVDVPVYFHAIINTSGAGTVSLNDVNAQLAVLNNAFTGFNFQLASGGFNTVTNDAWYSCSPNNDSAMKNALRQGGANTMNI